MRTTSYWLTIVLAVTLLAGGRVYCQTPPETIEELTAAIAKLEAIDRNPQTPSEIKEINQGFLTEKRQKLLALLISKRTMRRDYLSAAASALSTDQIVKVEREIAELESLIKQLQPLVPGAANPVMPDSGSTADGSPRNATQPANAGLETNTTTATQPTNDGTENNTTTAPTNAGMIAPATGGQNTDTTTGPTTQGAQLKALLGSAVQRIRDAKTTNPTATIDLRNTFMLLAVSLTEETRKKVVADFTSKAEEAKPDKQTGASQGNGASTSLVSKAGIPAVLGFAVENGALTRTENKTGITFSGTPVGIIEALAKRGYIDSYQRDDSFDRFLRNFSFKITFDPNRGSSPGTFTGSPQQVSGYSLRYKIIDQRDARDKKYTARWSSLVENQAVPVTRSLAIIFTKLHTQPTPAFAAWRSETEAAIAAASAADVETVLVRQLEKLRKIDLGPEVTSQIATFSGQFDDFLRARDDILDQVNAGWISTIEYNNERRVGLPSISNIRFIAEKGAYNGSLDLTANASFSFYNSLLPGANTNRIRDFRFAGQLDVPLGNVATTGKFFLSFAGLYERLVKDENLSNGITTAPKGDIATGQVKLTIPIRGTAFKIPLSVSFANRTELINEKHVRGNFGITFDLDSLLAKFNPFTQK